MFLGVATLFGVCFALTLPPLGGYDEGLHFLRAWQVSDGGIFATSYDTPDGDTQFGGEVPDALIDDFEHLYVDGIFADDATNVWNRINDPAPDGDKRFVEFSSSAIYAPVPYLPSAVAIRIGRALGLSTFALILVGRLASLAAFVTIVGLALRRLRGGRQWTLALLALLPVAVFQAATISADTITGALALLVVADAIALTLREPADVTRVLLVETALATIALALSKPPYILVAALLLVPLWRHRQRLLVPVGATLVVAAVFAGAWSAYAADRHVPQEFAGAYLDVDDYAYRDVDPDAQFSYLRGEPWAFAGVLTRTALRHGDEIGPDVFAQSPWWRIPPGLVLAAVVALVLLALRDAAPPLARAFRLTGAAVALVLVLAVSALAYAGWNAVEAPRIDAFQGRYLFPAVAVALLTTLTTRWSCKSATDRLGPFVVGGFAVLLLVLQIGLVREFY